MRPKSRPEGPTERPGDDRKSRRRRSGHVGLATDRRYGRGVNVIEDRSSYRHAPQPEPDRLALRQHLTRFVSILIIRTGAYRRIPRLLLTAFPGFYALATGQLRLSGVLSETPKHNRDANAGDGLYCRPQRVKLGAGTGRRTSVIPLAWTLRCSPPHPCRYPAWRVTAESSRREGRVEVLSVTAF
jgi:hypothetical protein